MKRKIVLWGTNEKDEKILVALQLLDREGKVNLYTFNENLATEDFYNTLLNQWREGVEVEFPEGYTLQERPLNISDSILPDDIKVDRTDIISRAQTEWHFVVLSAKLYLMYRSELEDFQETVENLKGYDNKIWNEMRDFWSKVNEQVIEKNLFRDHAASLKNKTNKLFDRLKALRKKVEEEFEEVSTKHKETLMKELQEIEDKISNGLGLKPIFEELKNIQNRLKAMKFTRNDRNKIWDRLDKNFKVVKEKRFGDKGSGNNQNTVSRSQSRYDGLINAISKMEKSIHRDKEDQKFEDRKIASSEGQLEMQIRQAKIKMIEERIRSKEVKLEDMYKTRKDLEERIAREKQKEEKRKMMADAKATAEAKIADKIKKSADSIEISSDKLKAAAAEIKASKQSSKKKIIPPVKLPNVEADGGTESTEKEKTGKQSESKSESANKKGASEGKKGNDSKNDNLMDAISETMGEAISKVEDAIEDVVDTVKAVADVVEDKIKDKFSDEANKESEPKDEKSGEKKSKKDEPFLGSLTDKVGKVMGSLEDVFEDVAEKVKAVADVVEDKIEDAVDSFNSEEE